MAYMIYQDDEGEWHAEELGKDHKPTGFVLGPYASEEEADAAADAQEGGA